MKKTFKVDPENVSDEYKNIVKEEMTYQEISQLGQIVMKQKIAHMKNRWYRWKYARKNKNNNKEKISRNKI